METQFRVICLLIYYSQWLVQTEETQKLDAEQLSDVSDQHLKIFQALFQLKRADQRDAVNSIMKYDAVKQYKLIEAIFVKAIQVLEDSQVKLREAGYVPGMKFPVQEYVREALSLCLENTAFLSEIILHFPVISHRLITAQKSYSLIVTWGVFFASQSDFLDKNTKKLIYLVSQELGLAEKDPDYNNPYFKKVAGSQSSHSDYKAKEKKPKKKKTFKRGPTLSREFGDL